MNPAHFDPNNPPPELSPGDCWDDTEILEGQPASTILPPRRTAVEPAPASAPAASSEGPDTGFRIESNLARRSDSEDFQRLEVQEISSDVVRLEQTIPAPLKAPRTTKFIERGSRVPATRNPRGEGHEWGYSQRQSVLWMVGIGGGVIALVILAMVLLPGINESNAVRELPAGRSLKVVEAEAVEGIDALNRMFAKQPEAEQIFHRYLRVGLVGDALPLLRDGQSHEEIIRREWKPTSVPENWPPAKDFTWQVVKSGAHYCGVLEGTLSDFTKFSAYFANQDDRLWMDWKATTGYSSASFENLAKGTGDAREIRGSLVPSNFYTAVWPEAEYLSYQMVSPTGETAIWCYASRQSPPAGALSGLFQTGEILRETEGPKKVTLYLEPGPAGRLPNQWLIAELLHTDWITL
jgi:hypothetical protein